MSNALKSIKRANTTKAMKDSQFILDLGVEPSAKMDKRATEQLLLPESMHHLQLLTKMPATQIKQMISTCGPTARMKLLVALIDLKKTAAEEKKKLGQTVKQALRNENGEVLTPTELQEAAVEQAKRMAESIPGAIVTPDGRLIVPPSQPSQPNPQPPTT